MKLVLQPCLLSWVRALISLVDYLCLPLVSVLLRMSRHIWQRPLPKLGFCFYFFQLAFFSPSWSLPYSHPGLSRLQGSYRREPPIWTQPTDKLVRVGGLPQMVQPIRSTVIWHARHIRARDALALESDTGCWTPYCNDCKRNRLSCIIWSNTEQKSKLLLDIF